LRKKLGDGRHTTDFAVAGDTFVNLVTQALKRFVQGIEIRRNDAQQRLMFRPTATQFNFSAV
jgi:hypothetical protein